MVEIKRTVTESVVASDGQELCSGDKVLLKVGTQFVLTTFVGFDKGYIVTKNLDDEIVKYRRASIEKCQRVLDISFCSGGAENAL